MTRANVCGPEITDRCPADTPVMWAPARWAMPVSPARQDDPPGGAGHGQGPRSSRPGSARRARRRCGRSDSAVADCGNARLHGHQSTRRHPAADRANRVITSQSTRPRAPLPTPAPDMAIGPARPPPGRQRRLPSRRRTAPETRVRRMILPAHPRAVDRSHGNRPEAAMRAPPDAAPATRRKATSGSSRCPECWAAVPRDVCG